MSRIRFESSTFKHFLTLPNGNKIFSIYGLIKPKVRNFLFCEVVACYIEVTDTLEVFEVKKDKAIGYLASDSYITHLKDTLVEDVEVLMRSYTTCQLLVEGFGEIVDLAKICDKEFF